MACYLRKGCRDVTLLYICVTCFTQTLGASRRLGNDNFILKKIPRRHAHGDLSSLAPHERLPEILVVPREKTPTGAAARGQDALPLATRMET